MLQRLFLRFLPAFSLWAATSAAQIYTITSIAGNGAAGFADGDALSAQFNFPGGIAVDSSGKLYVADSLNNRIRLISGGSVSTLAGNGTSGYTGDNGNATSAELNHPGAVAVDASGNLYIADTGNHAIRKVTGSTITTIAGSNNGGSSGDAGDGGAAKGALLNSPAGIAVDSSGNVYISDTNNNRIRRIDTKGIITGIVGSGSTANTLDHPTGIAIDNSGALYIADTNHHRIVKWANNKLTPVAGTGVKGFSGDGGPAIQAMLQNPIGVAVDAAGDLYIADSSNSRIRKVTPDGMIVTIAGNGQLRYSGDGGPATSAALYFPRGVAVDSQGNVYIADTSNQLIRLLQGTNPFISDGGVTNAASYLGQISPGALATVWGSNFGTASGSNPAPWSTSLLGVSVKVNGNPAPVNFVSPNQINFQVPWGTPVGTAQVTVSVNGGSSNAVSVPVVSAGPGLFVSGGAAIVQNEDHSLNSPSNPAAAGSIITAYLTGSGPVSAAQVDGVPVPIGSLVQLTSSSSAKIGSADATVQFAGLTPGSIGLAQMNIVVPPGLAPGTYPLVVTINGEASNSGNISVK